MGVTEKRGSIYYIRVFRFRSISEKSLCSIDYSFALTVKRKCRKSELYYSGFDPKRDLEQ